MREVDHYDLLNWADSWPMGFVGRRKWKLHFLSMTEVKRLRCCWDENGRRFTLNTVHRRITKKNWLNKRHCICSRARDSSIERRPFVLVMRNVVLDGNHLLLALIERGYSGKVLVGESISKPLSNHTWLPRELYKGNE